MDTLATVLNSVFAVRYAHSNALGNSQNVINTRMEALMRPFLKAIPPRLNVVITEMMIVAIILIESLENKITSGIRQFFVRFYRWNLFCQILVR